MPYRIDLHDIGDDALDRLVELGALDVERLERSGIAALMPDELPLEEGEDEQEELDLDPEAEEGDTGDGDEDDGEAPSRA